MSKKRAIVSGATGYVGRFIVEGLLSAGHDVKVLGRTPPHSNFFSQAVTFAPMSLSQDKFEANMFHDCDAFVHAAFHHVAGRYRGGEGDNPEEFERLNHLGSMALFNAAKAAGVPRVFFLSSRAVYGKQTPGEILFETTSPRPDTLYGKVKLQTERALEELSDSKFLPIILRATGVYGPASQPSGHKWHDLFQDFRTNQPIAPRVGTEVYGEDLAEAISLLLSAKTNILSEISQNERAPIFNISDIVLDRYELLKAYDELMDHDEKNLPHRADTSSLNTMNCQRLKALGWQPLGHLNLSWLT